MFSKKNKIKKLLFCLFVLIFTKNAFAKNIKESLADYADSLNNFSAKFIQSNEATIEEGVIYIGDKRIKVDYILPSKITLILDKNKSMYYNKDLKEVEYFNTKKSEASIFFDILKNQNFLKNADITNLKNQIVIKKNYIVDDTLYLVELIFEQNPYLLRKIKLNYNENFYTISFFNHNHNETFNNKFFSLANPLIIN